jgi:hypothetical protein
MKKAPNKIFQSAYEDTPPGRKANNFQEVLGSAPLIRRWKLAIPGNRVWLR